MTTITQTNNNSSIKSFIEEALKGSFAKLPKAGEVVQGVVLGKENSTLYIDLGAFGMGVVYGREFNEAHDMIKGMDIGDVVSAKVVEPENEEGLMELSLKEASYEMAWSDIVKKKESGETIEVEIKDANKGGLIANLGGIMAFMPVSQLLTEHYPRVDGGDKSKIYQELMKFVGKKFRSIYDNNLTPLRISIAHGLLGEENPFENTPDDLSIRNRAGYLIPIAQILARLEIQNELTRDELPIASRDVDTEPSSDSDS